MHQDGVDVRPLREMTGRAMFNEVFLNEARVPADHVVGEIGGGWAVANTTLMVERGSAGGGNVAAPSAAVPGTIAGDLEKPAGSFAGQVGATREGVVDAHELGELIALARQRGVTADPVLRQDIARLYSLVTIADWQMRAMQVGIAPGAGNIAKLRNSEIVRQARDLGCRILGADAMIGEGMVHDLTLMSPAPSIYGGSDQVQRNIIGERVLGLGKEPGPSKDTPFRALLRN
jgi:alkylation response protein AidB-like acyl-CoA dehydrogenase